MQTVKKTLVTDCVDHWVWKNTIISLPTHVVFITLLLDSRPEVLREIKKHQHFVYIVLDSAHVLENTQTIILTGFCNVILKVILLENNFLKEESCVFGPSSWEINRVFKEKIPAVYSLLNWPSLTSTSAPVLL